VAHSLSLALGLNYLIYFTLLMIVLNK